MNAELDVHVTAADTKHTVALGHFRAPWRFPVIPRVGEEVLLHHVDADQCPLEVDVHGVKYCQAGCFGPDGGPLGDTIVIECSLQWDAQLTPDGEIEDLEGVINEVAALFLYPEQPVRSGDGVNDLVWLGRTDGGPHAPDADIPGVASRLAVPVAERRTVHRHVGVEVGEVTSRCGLGHLSKWMKSTPLRSSLFLQRSNPDLVRYTCLSDPVAMIKPSRMSSPPPMK